MATMQQCVSKMKEKNMQLNPDTCKFEPKRKAPILKKGRNVFEVRENLSTGLNAELGELPPVYQDTKNQWSPIKFTAAQMKKEKIDKEKEKIHQVAIAQLQPTNNASKLGNMSLQNILNNEKRHNKTRWTKKQKPANVRSSINVLRKTLAKKRRKPYNLQTLVPSNRVTAYRSKFIQGNPKKTRVQSRRNAEARARAKIAQPVNIEVPAPVKKTRQRKQKQNSPAPNTNKLKKRVLARKAKAERLEAERLAELQRVLNQSNSNSKSDSNSNSKSDSNSNSKSDSNSNGSNSNSSNDSWELYQKREGEKHMAR